MNSWSVGSDGVMRNLSGQSVFVSAPIRSMQPFFGLEFVANQRDPYQIMPDPSFATGDGGWVAAELDSEESIETALVNFGARGSVMSVTGDGGGVARGAQSEVVPMRTGGMARATADFYLAQTLSHGKWSLSVVDKDGALIARTGFVPTPRKWERHSFEFHPQPAGGWLFAPDGVSEYQYRRRISLSPSGRTLTKGTAVLVTRIDKSVMASETGSDFRVAYYDGTGVSEIPYDYTDAGELWFALQADVPAGRTPDGTFDDRTNRYLGSYHIYYKNANVLSEPDYEPNDVFMSVEAELTAAISDGEPLFDGTGALWYQEPVAVPYGSGHLTLLYTPSSNIAESAPNERRYLVDAVPSGAPYSVEVYFYESRLYAMITHRSGFRSGAVFSTNLTGSLDGSTLEAGTRYRILISWGDVGSQGYADTEAREIRAWCVEDGNPSVGGEMTLIENQYDRMTYDDTTEPVRY